MVFEFADDPYLEQMLCFLKSINEENNDKSHRIESDYLILRIRAFRRGIFRIMSCKNHRILVNAAVK